MGQEAEVRAINAQPWEPLPGMVKRRCLSFGMRRTAKASSARRPTS
jgi:hypothetical protein